MPEEIKAIFKAKGGYTRLQNHGVIQHYSPVTPIYSKSLLHKYIYILNKFYGYCGSFVSPTSYFLSEYGLSCIEVLKVYEYLSFL